MFVSVVTTIVLKLNIVIFLFFINISFVKLQNPKYYYCDKWNIIHTHFYITNY